MWSRDDSTHYKRGALLYCVELPVTWVPGPTFPITALPDIENLATTLLETPKGESDMASRREAANHEAQIQERACPAENKARPSRLGACQDRRDRKFEVVRIAAQL